MLYPQVCLGLDMASTKNCFWCVPWLFKPSLLCLWACAHAKCGRLPLQIRQFSALLVKVAFPRVWSYQTNILVIAGAVVLQAVVGKPVNTAYFKFWDYSLGSTEACTGIPFDIWRVWDFSFLEELTFSFPWGKKIWLSQVFRLKRGHVSGCEWSLQVLCSTVIRGGYLSPRIFQLWIQV